MTKNNLFIFIFIFSFSGHAFTLNNSAKLVFAKDEIKVNLARGFCNNLGISDDEFLTFISTAVDQFWNRSPTSRLKLKKGTLLDVSSDFQTATICTPSTNCVPNPDLAVPSDILITCNNNASNFSSSSILGVTIPNNISGKTILGSLVMINDLASTQFSTLSSDEKVAIIAHELGHAFGLGHSPVEDSLMYFSTVTKRDALGRDDIDGISYLYPKQQPISSCGTIDLNEKNGASNIPSFMLGLFVFGIVFLCKKKSFISRDI